MLHSGDRVEALDTRKKGKSISVEPVVESCVHYMEARFFTHDVRPQLLRETTIPPADVFILYSICLKMHLLLCDFQHLFCSQNFRG